MLSFMRGIAARSGKVVPNNIIVSSSIEVLGIGQSLMENLTASYSGNGEAALITELENYYTSASFNNQGKNGSPLTKAAAGVIPRTDNWWDETANGGVGGKGPTYINRIDPITNKQDYQAIVFNQGSTDGKTSTPKAVYKQALQDMFAQLKTDFPNATIYLCPWHRRNLGGPSPAATDENMQPIREAHLETIDEIAYVKYGVDLYDEPLNDFTHLTSAGNASFGAKIGRRLASDLSSRGNYGFGPSLENLSLTGSALSFDIVQNDGGNDWVAPTEFTNIRVEVDGISYPIASVTYTDSTSGVFTLVSAPPTGSSNVLYTHWGMGAELNNSAPGLLFDNASDKALPVRQQIVSFTNNNAAATAFDRALAWYKADEVEAVTDDGSGNVTQWNDKSSNGYHLTQPSASYRPKTGTRTLNGKNVIDFAGAHILFNGAMDFGAPTPEMTVFAVFVADIAAQTGGIYGYSNNWTDSGEVFGMSSGDNSSNFKPSARYFNGYLASSDTQTLGQAVVTLHRYPEGGVHNNTEIYINGVAHSLSGNGGANSLNFQTGSPQFALGAYRDANTAYFDGTIAEVLVFDSVLTNSDRNEVGNYLSSEWGVSWTNI